MSNHTITTIHDDGKYVGWPTVARDPASGRLFVAFSGKRRSHVCPYGQVLLITSDDDGATWSEPKVLANGPLDDRDAGILITSRGTLLVNWFTSVAFKAWEGSDRYPEEASRLTDNVVGDELGDWMLRSSDGGESFDEERVATFANSPHGPCELIDGSLLYIGKLIADRETRISSLKGPHSSRVGIARSFDDGRTWAITSDNLPAAEGQDVSNYCEFHAVEADNGTLIAQIRNHSTKPMSVWQMTSDDKGETWSSPREICVGSPSHLLKLNDGCILMSYSHREDPMSNLARVSEDHGATWTRPFVFGPTVPPRDMGYPSTVQLPDDELLSVWYEQTDWERAVLRMARWRLPPPLSSLEAP